MPLTNQDNPYSVVQSPYTQPVQQIPQPVAAPPFQQQIYPPGVTPICPQLGPGIVPLYPPLFFPERRRRDDDPAISVNVSPNQIVSGGLLFDNTIFQRGRIDRSGNSIVIRKRGTYIITFDVNVKLTPPTSSTATATFTLNPISMIIANLTVSSPTTQLLSGSQIVDLYKDTFLSITDVLSNATVLSGTFSVARVSERRRPIDVIV